eukprot:TRINITY_DN852_c1_g1_i1.p1 TRINITY_DN852_c1_g1~~TRINITY_DN852_c1_g1_i1.p1  ORF type:complete len:232 (+),score=49.61 TRINITY_DN852_c1_g1_i1:84-779(+)
MPYGSNGINTDGTSMNVNNSLGSRSSIRLLGREKGYDTGHTMAALLGLRTMTDDEKRVMDANEKKETSKSRRGGDNPHFANRHLATSTEWQTPPMVAKASPPRPAVMKSPVQETEAHYHTELRVGMKVVTTKKIDLHSGNSVPEGVVGVVSKIPGEIRGTIAEVDIPSGPLFDAWPGTVTAFFERTELQETTAIKMNTSAAGRVSRIHCPKCKSDAIITARFCPNCGSSLR